MRAALARERIIMALGLVFPAVTLTLLLGYGVWLTRAQTATCATMRVRIEVTGEQWWWRVSYTPAPTPVASANEIRIPVGRPVGSR